MICSKCKTELKPDATVCLKCGQPVSAKPLGFPCVICGEPIPPGVEECSHCGGSVSKAPANAGSLSDVPQAEKPVVDALESPELDSFELDEISIAAPPPPPPPRRTQAAVEGFEPLPNLVPRDPREAEFPTLAAKPEAEPAPTEPVPPPAVVTPKPATAPHPVSGTVPVAVQPALPPAPKTTTLPPKPPVMPTVVAAAAPMAPLPPQTEPVAGVIPVRPAGLRPVATASVPQSAGSGGVSTSVPASPASAAPKLPVNGPLPPVQPIPELQAVRRPRVATLPSVYEASLGPQPEDVVDEAAAKRRKAVFTLLGGIAGVVVVLGLAGYLVLTKPWHRVHAEPESLQEKVNRQFTDNRLAAPVPLPAASPVAVPEAVGAESAPEAAASVVPETAVSVPEAAPVPPTVVAVPPKTETVAEKPAARREPAARASSKHTRRSASTEEEDAYLRQIRRQLRQ